MNQSVYTRQPVYGDAADTTAPNGHEPATPGPAPASDSVGREPACPQLVGTWHLRAACCTDAAGRAGTLYEREGAEAGGYYVRYRENGAVCLVAARAGRPTVSPLDLIGVGNLLIEAVGAGDVRLAACGSYTFAAGILAHRLGGGCFPAWLGLEREHLTELAGDILVWRTPPLDGAPRATRLVWERG